MNSERTVLLIDDEVALARLIRLALTPVGLVLRSAETAAAGLAMARTHPPDIVLLDIKLPGASGHEILPSLKALGLLVIVVSANNDRETRAQSLELGADDYVEKPFSPDELVSRIRFLLRMDMPFGEGSIIHANGAEIDVLRELLRVHGEIVNFSKTEWALLRLLAARGGEVVLNQELLSKVWGGEYRDDVEFLRAWIARLRQKLGDSPTATRVIAEFHGVGYQLVVSSLNQY